MARNANDGPPDLRAQAAKVAGLRSSGARWAQQVFTSSPTEGQQNTVTPEQLFSYNSRRQLRDAAFVLGVNAGNASKVNPFRGMPTNPTGRQMQTILDLYVDTKSEMSDRYNPKNDEYAYGDQDSSPAPLTIVPTSTSNPERPRTVAAGYEMDENGVGRVTVVFRDGTYWNYYEVPVTVWEGFKTSLSKGVFIKDVLDGYPYGAADIGALDARVRSIIETVYAISRTSQKYAYRPGTKAAKGSGSAGAINRGRKTAPRYKKPRQARANAPRWGTNQPAARSHHKKK